MIENISGKLIFFARQKLPEFSYFLLFLKCKTKINWLPCRKWWKINLQKQKNIYIKLFFQFLAFDGFYFPSFPRWKIFNFYVVWFMLELKGRRWVFYAFVSLQILSFCIYFSFCNMCLECISLYEELYVEYVSWSIFFMLLTFLFYFLVVSLINKSHTASIKSDP